MHLSFILFYIISITIIAVNCKKFSANEKPDWAKKDIRDYNEADMERLLDQWEEDEEPLEPDELPEHLRPQPQIDLTNLDMNNPEGVLSATKKGRTLMSFVKVKGKPTRDETEEVTKLWQTSLWNNHVQAERYLVDDDRAIFLFKDGSQAWEAKDFLITQDKFESITIEGKEYTAKDARKTDEL